MIYDRLEFQAYIKSIYRDYKDVYNIFKKYGVTKEEVKNLDWNALYNKVWKKKDI